MAQQGMIPRVSQVIAQRLAIAMARGEKKESGLISFANYEYLVTIKRLRKRRIGNLFGLLKRRMA